MNAAAKPRLVIVFVMLLSMGVSMGLPAEDVLDAVYDESEALPCESTPLFSIMLSPVAARTTQFPLSSSDPKPADLSLFAPAHFRDTDTDRSADTRASLVLLCTLLC